MFSLKHLHEGADTQTSLAQIFSGVGEGLVLKGEKAIVDKKRDRKAHLDERGAEQLARRAPVEVPAPFGTPGLRQVPDERDGAEVSIVDLIAVGVRRLIVASEEDAG